MKFTSPAKINLHLRILRKKADGYHEIQSLMRCIDLFDELEIGAGSRGIEVTAEGSEVPDGEGNLAYRAARIWSEASGKTENISIRIRKRIPVAAGLGGGSSNAATVLIALNQIYRTGFTREELMGLGVKIGGDVPFFIFGRSALARGIGERLSPANLPEEMGLLLLIPPFPISTAWAYTAYDELKTPEKSISEIGNSYPSLEELISILENDLEAVAFARYPQMSAMKTELLKCGARGALMSGSGSSMFGIFPTRREAERGAVKLPLPSGWKALIAGGI